VLTYVGGEWEELRVDGRETESLTGLKKKIVKKYQMISLEAWRDS